MQDALLANGETALRAVFDTLATHRSVLVVVDQAATAVHWR